MGSLMVKRKQRPFPFVFILMWDLKYLSRQEILLQSQGGTTKDLDNCAVILFAPILLL